MLEFFKCLKVCDKHGATKRKKKPSSGLINAADNSDDMGDNYYYFEPRIEDNVDE